MDVIANADGDSYQDLRHLSSLQDKQEKIIEIKQKFIDDLLNILKGESDE